MLRGENVTDDLAAHPRRRNASLLIFASIVVRHHCSG
jgi:hypothetical protein